MIFRHSLLMISGRCLTLVIPTILACLYFLASLLAYGKCGSQLPLFIHVGFLCYWICFLACAVDLVSPAVTLGSSSIISYSKDNPRDYVLILVPVSAKGTSSRRKGLVLLSQTNEHRQISSPGIKSVLCVLRPSRSSSFLAPPSPNRALILQPLA